MVVGGHELASHVARVYEEVSMLVSVESRSLQPELMDDRTLAAGEHAVALRGLQRIHAFTGTENRFWKSLLQIAAASGCRSLSVVDVGCGDGHLLRQLWKRGQRRGLELTLTGVDISHQALAMASHKSAEQNIPIDWARSDILQGPLPVQADVVMCSLFLHHFETDHIPQILERLVAAAERGIVIEDLIRSRFGYALCLFGVHLLSRSRIVHTDGPLSVRAAFRMDEMKELLGKAGLSEASVQRRWPERFLVEWVRQTQGP